MSVMRGVYICTRCLLTCVHSNYVAQYYGGGTVQSERVVVILA